MSLINITYDKTSYGRIDIYKYLFFEKIAIKDFIKNSQLTEL